MKVSTKLYEDDEDLVYHGDRDSGSFCIMDLEGKYRYLLGRTLADNGPDIAFVMLNPSTADHIENDRTIDRLTGFCGRWGAGRLLVANLFAYRATDPTELSQANDPVGLYNNLTLFRLAELNLSTIVVAWGASIPGNLLGRVRTVREILSTTRTPVRCLGRTKFGQPRHPLYLKGDTPLESYTWDRMDPSEGDADLREFDL